jgi:RTX calcium-binding nonapeptide repeat (4 copies)
VLPISKTTSSILPVTTPSKAARPPLEPLYRDPYGDRIDPRYRAVEPEGSTSYRGHYRNERLGTDSLPPLDGLTKWMSRMKHYISGPDFPEVTEGLFTWRQVDGTPEDDVIEVRYEPSTGGAYVTKYQRVKAEDPSKGYFEKRNETTSYLNADEARRLRIDAGDGHDRVEVDPSFPYPVYIRGGAGRDTLIGGAGDDIFEGGSGENYIFGNGGNDRAHTVLRDEFGNLAAIDHLYLGMGQPEPK